MPPILTLIVPCTPWTRDVDMRLAVAGRPLLEWTLQAAEQASTIDRILVVTTDADLGELASRHRAEIVAPPRTEIDEPPTAERIGLQLLETLAEGEGFHPEFLLYLDPAFPLRSAKDVNGAITLLRQRHADAVFSATELAGFVWRRREGDWACLERGYHDPERRESPSDSVVENGGIYAVRPRVLQRTKNRFGGKIVVYRMPPEHSWHVRTAADVDFAERLIGASKLLDTDAI